MTFQLSRKLHTDGSAELVRNLPQPVLILEHPHPGNLEFVLRAKVIVQVVPVPTVKKTLA